mmetsp:Transcript_27704/g.93082  ORF Transcript_27704/g.93082 Transcript_27704/m.93082 type:complete len:272 (+) Transcript_27704:373-1188(+)
MTSPCGPLRPLERRRCATRPVECTAFLASSASQASVSAWPSGMGWSSSTDIMNAWNVSSLRCAANSARIFTALPPMWTRSAALRSHHFSPRILERKACCIRNAGASMAGCFRTNSVNTGIVTVEAPSLPDMPLIRLRRLTAMLLEAYLLPYSSFSMALSSSTSISPEESRSYKSKAKSTNCARPSVQYCHSVTTNSRKSMVLVPSSSKMEKTRLANFERCRSRWSSNSHKSICPLPSWSILRKTLWRRATASSLNFKDLKVSRCRATVASE